MGAQKTDIHTINFTFNSLFKHLLYFRAGLTQIFILHLIWILLELMLPFITQSLVDKGINNQDYHFIFLVLSAQLMLFLGNITADYSKAWILKHMGIRLNMRLINSMLFKLMMKDILYFKQRKDGELIQFFNDTGRIERFLTENASAITDAILRLLLYGFVLYIFNPLISLIFVVSVVISVIWDTVFLKTREKYDHVKFEASSTARSELLEVINGIPDIKMNNQEWTRLEGWRKVQDLLSKTRLEMLRLTQLYQGGTNFINQLRDVFVIYFAATQVVEGTMTLGSMLAIQYILGQLNKQTIAIMEFVQAYHDAKLSLERIQNATSSGKHEFIPEEEFNERSISAKIKVDDLYFDYTGVPCMMNLNLDIPFGSKIALVGESGCGKTTLTKNMLKLLKPDTGRILVGSTDLNNIPDNTWRSNCAVLLQEGYVFANTVQYNITFETEDHLIDHNRLHKVLQWSCLDKIIEEQNLGLKTKIGKGGKTFSKGQTQRILLARSLYKEANYLFLDEPTSALDMRTSKKVINNIFNNYADKTVIFATHKIEMAKYADYIYLMKEGKIIEHGNYEDLIANKGAFYALFKG